MPKMLLTHLIRLLPPDTRVVVPHGVPADPTVDHLCFRLADCRPGSLFFAWHGANSDGHAFAPQAVVQGAVACVVARELPQLGAVQIVAPDPRRLLGHIGHLLFGTPQQKLRLVAITGTSGKTTCAHLVAAILAEAFDAAGIIGTLGHGTLGRGDTQPHGPHFGTGHALTTPEGSELAEILAAWRSQGIRAGVLEASSIALVQGRLEGLRCDVALMTNLSREHLDFHGTLSAYFAAKALLFAHHIKEGGTAVLNADDPAQDVLDGPQVIRFSAEPPHRQRRPADVFVRKSNLGTAGIDAIVATPGDELPLTSPLVGAFNLSNLVAAVSVGLALNMAPPTITRALSRLPGVRGRLERVPPPHASGTAPLVLVDYAHKPEALRAAAVAARALCRGQLWCVFGCGGERDTGKRAQMGQISAQMCDKIIVTNDNPRGEDPELIAAQIAVGLGEAGARRHEAQDLVLGDAPGFAMVLDRRAAIELAVSHAGPDDVVLVAGKGHETYQQVKETKLPFDDREVAQGALASRSKSQNPSPLG